VSFAIVKVFKNNQIQKQIPPIKKRKFQIRKAIPAEWQYFSKHRQHLSEDGEHILA
jgi:hypothetical protein